MSVSNFFGQLMKIVGKTLNQTLISPQTKHWRDRHLAPKQPDNKLLALGGRPAQSKKRALRQIGMT